MSNKSNPFDDLFDQIGQILSFVKDHQNIPSDELKIPPDIEKRLEKLRKKIANFNMISDDIVRLSGVSGEELNMRLNGRSDQLPAEGKQLIARSHEIKSEAQNINDQLEKQLEHLPLSDRSLSAKTDKPQNKIVDDKDYAKKRRSKFKRFGGDQNWKPL